MATYDYKNLDVWQKAMNLAEAVYVLCEKLPVTEKYGLISQLQRSAVSVPSNIAEGQKRISRGETIHFTGIALGSNAELETQIILISRIYKLEVDELLLECEQVGKMLTGLLRSLRSELKDPSSR